MVSVIQKKPEIVVFAGPNGSGKSTFTELLKPPIDYIDADEIKKHLKCSDLEAAQIAEKQREEHVERMEEFWFVFGVCSCLNPYGNMFKMID